MTFIESVTQIILKLLVQNIAFIYDLVAFNFKKVYNVIFKILFFSLKTKRLEGNEIRRRKSNMKTDKINFFLHCSDDFISNFLPFCSINNVYFLLTLLNFSHLVTFSLHLKTFYSYPNLFFYTVCNILFIQYTMP